MEISLLAFALVFALASANGANDVSKAIATLVGSGVTDYRSAIARRTVWTVIGAALAAFVASAMIKTFSHGLVQTGTIIEPAVTLGVLTGAMAWVLFASRTGLPVSTTHALTGAIVGTGFVAFAGEGLIWSAIGKKIALPLLLSLDPRLRRLSTYPSSCSRARGVEGASLVRDAGLARRWWRSIPVRNEDLVSSRTLRLAGHGSTVAMRPRRLAGGWSWDSIRSHWISSGLAAFARGTNDAHRRSWRCFCSAVRARMAQHLVPACRLREVAMAMGLGSYFGGLRVTEVLAENVTRMDHAEGLSANLATCFTSFSSPGSLGLPVSTTHVSSSAIIGIGLLKGLNSVRWTTVRDMVLAWVVTLPASASLRLYRLSHPQQSSLAGSLPLLGKQSR